jgi:hypothetical protein
MQQRPLGCFPEWDLSRSLKIQLLDLSVQGLDENGFKLRR